MKTVRAAAVVVVAVTMVALSWRRWADPLIDYGRELYVPWQMSLGRALYADLAYPFGPLSAWLNSMLLRVGGVDATVIMVSNLVLVAALCGVIYRSARRWTAHGAAVCIAFLVLCAFPHLQDVGNYNMMSPYAQPLTHGLALVVGVVAAFGHFAASGRMRWAVVAHVLMGLALLTKPEVCIAGGAVLLVGWFCVGRRAGLKTWAWVVLNLMVTAAVAIVVARAILGPVRWPFGLISPWQLALRSTVAGTRFYGDLSGFTAMLRNIVQILMISGAEVLVCVALLAAARWTAQHRQWRRVLAGTVVVLCGVAVVCGPRALWLHIFRPLPLVCAILWWTLFRGVSRRPALLEPLLWTTLALALMLKIVLRVQLDHYGFALAAPAIVLAAVLWLDVAPAWFERRCGNRAMGLTVVWTVAAAILAWYGGTSVRHYREKTLPLGEGGDRIMVAGDGPSRSGPVLLEAMEWIATQVDPDDDMIVWPEGALLNYLTRRRASIPYYNVTPFELELVGESAVLAAIDLQRPEYILVSTRETSEMGAALFGVDYGLLLWEWVVAHYVEVERFGVWPADGSAFGLVVFKRHTIKDSPILTP